jgi:hypothetical protein
MRLYCLEGKIHALILDIVWQFTRMNQESWMSFIQDVQCHGRDSSRVNLWTLVTGTLICSLIPPCSVYTCLCPLLANSVDSGCVEYMHFKANIRNGQKQRIRSLRHCVMHYMCSCVMLSRFLRYISASMAVGKNFPCMTTQISVI